MTPFPMRLSRPDFNRIRAMAAARKARKAEKRVENESLMALKTGLEAPPRIEQASDGQIRTPRPRKRRKPSARKAAFNRLKAACKLYVLLRAKHRTAGMCEIAMSCGGENFATLAYHIIPAATGNAVKYDPRNMVGACSRCNGAEYFDRKRGSYERWDVRHRELLGGVLDELKALAGRKQILTHEAREMAAEYERKISAGEWG